MAVSSRWKCNHFSIAQPANRVPTLLRKVASEIHKQQPCDIFDMVLKFDGTHMVATVYYEKTRRRTLAKLSKARVGRSSDKVPSSNVGIRAPRLER